VEVAGEERRSMPSTVVEKQDGGKRKPVDSGRSDAKQADTK
jgi:hypothetical protein